MNIDKDLIKKVAKNAHLNLTESEIKEFLTQLKEILNNFSIINDINTNDIKPSFQPIEIKNIYREDKVEKSLTQEEALANTKHKKDGFFKGPKAI
ncbi:MAG: Asp-tRNA(Asn)/Glu-tRNA(Gln) amidotransferase subunit GatC [Candidatus Woesearchaeota archaeon]|nr:Asp-tRNA(Asn)/Glu-tRNA(Gln) amidotransferase subunit GatC [Candidatus Woesearchaeota archaeon]